jgi:SLT domain-containing protein
MTNIYRHGGPATKSGGLRTGNAVIDKIASDAQPILAASKAMASLVPNLGMGAFGGNPAAGGSFLGGGSSNYAADIATVLRSLSLPLTLVGNWMSQIQTESGGSLTVVNRTDANALAGHPSVGLLQMIPGTFASYAGPYANMPPVVNMGGGPVSENPMAQIYAAIHYALSAYGPGMGSVIGHGHGYSGGTSGAAPGWAWVGEQGKELVRFHGGEPVISHGDSLRAGASVIRGFAKGTTHPGDWNKQIIWWEHQEHLEFAKLAASKTALNKLNKQIPAGVTKGIATANSLIEKEQDRIEGLTFIKPRNWQKSVAAANKIISSERSKITKLINTEPLKLRNAIAAASAQEAAALARIATLKADINTDRTLIDEWQDQYDIGTGAAAPAGKWVGSGKNPGEWFNAGGVFGRQPAAAAAHNEQSQTSLLSRIAAAAEAAPKRTGQHVSSALNGTAGAASVRSTYNTQVGY